MSDNYSVWHDLISQTPLIIGAIFGGIVLLYKEMKSNKSNQETRDAIIENTKITKEGVDQTLKVHNSVNSVLYEAKDATTKLTQVSDEQLKVAEDLLRKSDADLAVIALKKENKKQVVIGLESEIQAKNAKIEELTNQLANATKKDS